MRRRVLFPRIGEAIATKANPHDPRGLVGQKTNNPYFQPDIAQFSDMGREMSRGMVAAVDIPGLNRAAGGGRNSGGLLRVQNITWTLTLTVANQPVLLIPKNLGRCDFLICNPSSSALLTFSYGFPALYAGLTVVPLGGTIKPHENFSPTGDTCAIDDIYIASDTVSIQIAAFEALESPEANA